MGRVRSAPLSQPTDTTLDLTKYLAPYALSDWVSADETWWGLARGPDDRRRL